MRVPNPVRTMDQFDQLNMAVMIMISPIKFGRGGSAKLARLMMNHQAAISGKIICRPRASSRVRLWVRS